VGLELVVGDRNAIGLMVSVPNISNELSFAAPPSGPLPSFPAAPLHPTGSGAMRSSPTPMLSSSPPSIPLPVLHIPAASPSDMPDAHNAPSDEVTAIRRMFSSLPSLSRSTFDLGATLGTGTFGRVRIVTYVPSAAQTALPAHVAPGHPMYMALKMLKKSEIIRLKQVEHIKAEKSILSRIAHPFIVNLYAAFQDERNLYMVRDQSAYVCTWRWDAHQTGWVIGAALRLILLPLLFVLSVRAGDGVRDWWRALLSASQGWTFQREHGALLRGRDRAGLAILASKRYRVQVSCDTLERGSIGNFGTIFATARAHLLSLSLSLLVVLDLLRDLKPENLLIDSEGHIKITGEQQCTWRRMRRVAAPWNDRPVVTVWPHRVRVPLVCV
jgi:hypothetical protein